MRSVVLLTIAVVLSAERGWAQDVKYATPEVAAEADDKAWTFSASATT